MPTYESLFGNSVDADSYSSSSHSLAYTQQQQWQVPSFLQNNSASCVFSPSPRALIPCIAFFFSWACAEVQDWWNAGLCWARSAAREEDWLWSSDSPKMEWSRVCGPNPEWYASCPFRSFQPRYLSLKLCFVLRAASCFCRIFSYGCHRCWFNWEELLTKGGCSFLWIWVGVIQSCYLFITLVKCLELCFVLSFCMLQYKCFSSWFGHQSLH